MFVQEFDLIMSQLGSNLIVTLPCVLNPTDTYISINQSPDIIITSLLKASNKANYQRN